MTNIESVINDKIGVKVQLSILLEIPFVAAMLNFNQQNRAHQYDLWNHCLHTVLNLPRHIEDDMLYLAALLHDIGKPDCQCHGKREDDSNMHYYGHPKRSMEIVRDDVIPALLKKGVHLTAEEQRRLLYYVEYHDDRVSLHPKHLQRHLEMASLEEFRNLMWLQVADAKAHVILPIIEKRIHICSIWAGEYGNGVYQELLTDSKKTVYERIKDGLEEAIQYEQGKCEAVTMHKVNGKNDINAETHSN